MPLDPSGLDFGAITPQEFAELVKDASRSELDSLMSGPERDRVLDEVFDRMTQQFRPDAGGHLNATVRWRLHGATDERTTYDMALAQGRCTTRRGETGTDPQVTISIGDVDFLKLVSGNAAGPALFMTRKLRADGDLGLAASLTRYFDIPRA